jgi:hypothetical protein
MRNKILILATFVLIIIGAFLLKSSHDRVENEKKFLNYYLEIADSSVARFENIYFKREEIDCDSMVNIKWFDELEKHFSKDTGVMRFGFYFNKASSCSRNIAFDEELFVGPEADITKQYITHIVNDNFALDIIILGYTDDKPGYEEYSGEIMISGKSINDDDVFLNKYNVLAEILIPKDFTHWKKFVGNKSFPEMISE